MRITWLAGMQAFIDDAKGKLQDWIKARTSNCKCAYKANYHKEMEDALAEGLSSPEEGGS